MFPGAAGGSRTCALGIGVLWRCHNWKNEVATIISAAKRDLYCENNTFETLRYRCIAYDMKSLEEINKVILRTPFDSSEACKGHDHTLKSKSKQPTEHFSFFFFCEHFSFQFTKWDEAPLRKTQPQPWMCNHRIIYSQGDQSKVKCIASSNFQSVWLGNFNAFCMSHMYRGKSAINLWSSRLFFFF